MNFIIPRNKMKKSTLSTLLVSGLIAPTAMIGLTATGAGAATLFTIDDFNSNITDSSDALSTANTNNNTVTFTRTGLTNVLGGTRKASVTRGAGTGLSARLQIADGGGLFDFSQPTGVSGSSFSLLYSNINSEDFSGVDFFSLGVDGISGTVNLSLQVSDGTNTATALKPVTSANDGTTISFSRSDFNNTIPFDAVTSLLLSGDGGTGFRILGQNGLVAVDVPEPSALGGLLVFGLLGFATAKKRANKNAQN